MAGAKQTKQAKDGKSNAISGIGSGREKCKLASDSCDKLLSLQNFAGNRDVSNLILKQQSKEDLNTCPEIKIEQDAKAQTHLAAESALAAAKDNTILAEPSAFSGRAGQNLFAHELAHVLQQNAKDLPRVSEPRAEADADTFAARFDTSQPVPVSVSQPSGWAYKKGKKQEKVPSDHKIIEVTIQGKLATLVVRKPDGTNYMLSYSVKINEKFKQQLSPRAEPYKMIEGEVEGLPRVTIIWWTPVNDAPLFSADNWAAEVNIYIRGAQEYSDIAKAGPEGRKKARGKRKGKAKSRPRGKVRTGAGAKKGRKKTPAAVAAAKGKAGAGDKGVTPKAMGPADTPIIKITNLEQLDELIQRGLVTPEILESIKTKQETGEPLSFEEAIALFDAYRKFVVDLVKEEETEEEIVAENWIKWAKFLEQNKGKISGQVKAGKGELTVQEVEEILAKQKRFVGISEGVPKTAKQRVEEWQRDPALRERWNELEQWERNLWIDYARKYGHTSEITDPESMEFSVSRGVRMSMALKMSTEFMGKGRGEAAAAILNDPMFQVGVVVSITAYLALWLMPEPVFTKAVAILTTIALLSSAAFTAGELYTFAQSWMALERAAGRARTLKDLEDAAENFGRSFGAQQVRILLVIAMHFGGKLLPAPKPLPPPSGGGLAGATAGGGTIVMARPVAPAQVKVLADGSIVVIGPQTALAMSTASGGGSGASGGPGTPKVSGKEAPRQKRRIVVRQGPGAKKGKKQAEQPKVEPKKKVEESQAARPETGLEMEESVLSAGRAARQASHSAEYFSYESGRNGSISGSLNAYRKHVTALRKSGQKVSHDKVDRSVLKQKRETIINGNSRLKAEWDKETIDLYRQLDRVMRLQRAAKGDLKRTQELFSQQRAIEAKIEARDKWAQGTVGKLQPDLFEIRPKAKNISVTDTTQRPFDPSHNFKTRLYVEVYKKLFGWSDVTGLEYYKPLIQKPL